MQRRYPQELTLGEWDHRVIGTARTSSASARPDSAFIACTYESTLGEFLDSDSYLVRFTDASGSKLVPYCEPGAKPILIRDFVQNDIFVQSVVECWYKKDLGIILYANLITLHCSGCDRRIVIDGVHRTTWLGSKNKREALVCVTELSGLIWSKKTPDMNVVCNCSDRYITCC